MPVSKIPSVKLTLLGSRCLISFRENIVEQLSAPVFKLLPSELISLQSELIRINSLCSINYIGSEEFNESASILK